MINIEKLNVYFLQNQILYDVSAKFEPNTITAIIGPSGGGKTTLLKSINRTAELVAGYKHCGKIYLNNQDIFTFQDAAAIRRMAGMVLQKPLALPFNIRENVLFGPKYYGNTDKTTLNEILKRSLTEVGLWEEVKDKLFSPASELSGGQLQRLSIARILAVEPQILLLDEPCSSLDINSTRLIESLLLSLKKQFTIVIVTHNLNQARRISDITYFMQAGKMVEYNKTEVLFSQPEVKETQEFLTNF